MMNDPEETKVCYDCIGDPFLKEEVRSEGRRTTCAYCGKRRKSVSLDELADHIHGVLDGHFYLTPSEPEGIEYTMAKEFGWERRGDPVDLFISEIAGLEEEIVKDIQEHLSDRFGDDAFDGGCEDPYGDQACYDEKGPDDCDFRDTWDFFRVEIRSRSRFFSQHAQRALNEIFGDIETLRTWDGAQAIREIRPTDDDRYIFRARVAFSDGDLQGILKDPVKGLGPPPSRKAKAGRMNAAGIPVFYGAMDEETCIAEARAPVGSQVALGRFEVIRTVRLLDFDILTKVNVEGSHFDPEYRTRYGRAGFLRHLVGEISRPVMPRDEEFEYLPTQAVSEYLASCVEPRLDGIVFHSSQTAGEGRNIVLFNHACGVEPYDLPEGTELDFRMGWETEDDYDDDIAIFENVPPDKSNEPDKSVKKSMFDPDVFLRTGDTRHREEDEDYSAFRDPTLRLDIEGVRVFRVQGISYKRLERSVRRYRRTKGKKGPF